jgi:hypothetical protein
MKTFLSMIPASALAVALLASAAPAAERYSDRDRMNKWHEGKKQLEESLKPGLDKTAYRKELENLGFQITAVDDDSPDSVEYEVVKGDLSYEIQIDMKGGKAEKVEVGTNLWKASTTRQAQASAEEIRQLQQALKEKGHDPGPIDGVMGPQTQQALRQFQQANGIQATGSLNAETKERLGLEAKAQTWEKTQVEGNRESGGGAGAAPRLP